MESYVLSQKDRDLVKTFRTLCRIDRRVRFSSDTFRMYGLDRFIRDPQHGIGGFFTKLLRQGKIRRVGHTRSQLPSNNLREIKLYEWVEDKEA